MNHFVIFFVSFCCILLELLFSRILNLKAWNHVVYIIIPFAMLGYGIGANFQIIANKWVCKLKTKTVISFSLILLAFFIYMSFTFILPLPIKVDYLLDVFNNFTGISMLLLAYCIFMIPFVIIGFLVVHLFSKEKKSSAKLYFFDLMGSSLAAFLFAPCINNFGITNIMYSMAILSLFIGLIFIFKKLKYLWICLGFICILFNFTYIKEIKEYSIDKTKGWEWIEGYYPQSQYEDISSKWHPLGRTDIFRITGSEAREDIFSHSSGTFEINITPKPEFSYISTNYLAGTPAYNYADFKANPEKYQLNIFSQLMEVPYVLLNDPKVLVIGAGGGRDIFMAKSHGATEVLAAEVNAAIVDTMSKGGKLYEYTDGIYDKEGVEVLPCDGRYLVKTQRPKSFDLIVLNGVDTYNGLSSGSYAYAESYLYTKNAIKDYLKILDDDGIINFNRWLFHNMPRETLKLMTISFEALKDVGAKEPWRHLLIGTNLNGWSLTLIKKSPFSEEEIAKVNDYFLKHKGLVFYPLKEGLLPDSSALAMFDKYAYFYKKGEQKEFELAYPFDISVITDDIPFFYKYYKLKDFNPFKSIPFYHTGTIIFLTQFLSLIQAALFILLFIFIPLIIFKKDALFTLSTKQLTPLFLYFSSLGVGFMFLEIPLMQRFVLLLGDPIYAISIVLAVLLSSAGIGSLSLKCLKNILKTNKNMMLFSTFFIAIYTFLFIILSPHINDFFVQKIYFLRVLATVIIIFPLGFFLGTYFPMALNLIGKKHTLLIPWAWALNSGFSVLGSIIAIILAQFQGFNSILQLAVAIYFIALLNYLKMEERLN